MWQVALATVKTATAEDKCTQTEKYIHLILTIVAANTKQPA